MDYAATLSRILSIQLGTSYPAAYFHADTELLGRIPELDSMAVVGILTAIEDELGVEVRDDEISAETFATFATLLAFLRAKHGAGSSLP
jgi:acyl carrier protein